MVRDLPNTHPLFDPEWADRQIVKHYADQIALASEITRYGSDLLLRASASAPEADANHLLINVLFRQALTAADAGFLALRNGVADAASVHARRLLEARWGLMLAFREPDKWGLHLHVAALRENRHLLRRLIPGTVEYLKYEAARKVTNVLEPPDELSVRQTTEAIEAIEAILARNSLSVINDGCEIGLKDLGHEPPWYCDGNAPKAKRLRSIRRLAIEVGALADYDTIYRYASYSVHGHHTATHHKFDDVGTAIAPLRTPEGFRSIVILLAAMACDCFRRLIDQYRSGEQDTFIGMYASVWQPRIFATKEVEVHLGGPLS